MKVVKAFLCEHCEKKVLKTRSGMRAHELRCFFNKKNKACRTCGNFQKEPITRYVPPRGVDNYGDDDYDELLCFCEVEAIDIDDFKLKVHCDYWKEKCD